jgi:CHRD domain
VSFIPRARRGGGASGSWRRSTGRLVRQARIRPGAGAAATAALATAAALALAAPAASASSAASASGAGRSTGMARHAYGVQPLALHAMPVGTIRFGRAGHGRLTVRARVFGLTPGSAHAVDLRVPGQARLIRFSTLTAGSGGQVSSVLHSRYSGPLRRGSRLLVRMGTGGGVAWTPIAETRRLSNPGHGRHRLIAVEISRGGTSYGTPHGRATLAYNASRQTLTVTVHASGVTPGPHAAHIHLGSCMSQGPVKYMLRDLVANRRGQIVHAVRVFTHVTAPIPAHGWYLNIHQGNSGNILSNGQPTIYFRPLLCADIGHGGGSGGSIFPILRGGDLVTGVRGMGQGHVILTGSAVLTGTQTAPSLYWGRLTRAAQGAAVSLLKPPFPGETTATFYGPNTHRFNPMSIPRGQVRAVGSYQSSSGPAGVLDQGMIYLGPVNGRGGSWTSIDVPAHGAHTAGHLRACPRRRPHCIVMDTIAHSTMGNLVVGNYDLNPTVHGGLASGNAFIYNMTRHQWTLLRLGGSQSSKTTLYGIWQDGGAGSPRYTLAGGSSAHGPSARGNQRAFLMNYNERTGAFGKPRFYNAGNRPGVVTHFEGITRVRGGFHLVAMSKSHGVSMAFVPVRSDGSFGPARWYPVKISASPLCSGGCNFVSGNTVYRDRVMGVYIPTASNLIHTYLATVRGR